MLAIDDAHLLDPPSAALVYLVARAENATVLGTLRNGEQVPLPIRALWTDDLVEHVELAPLPPAETTDLLAAMLGGPVDPASADRLRPAVRRQRRCCCASWCIAAQRQRRDAPRRTGCWRWTGRLELAPNLTDLIDARIGKLTARRPRGAWSWSRSASRSACTCSIRPPTRPTWRPPRNAG